MDDRNYKNPQWEEADIDLDKEDMEIWMGEDSDEAALRHMYEETRKLERNFK